MSKPQDPAAAETARTTDSPAVAPATTCYALQNALALVDFGPCRDAARPQDWINVAGPMCAHCVGTEDVNLAAARIIAAAYKELWFALAKVRHNAIAIQNVRWGHDGDCGVTRLANCIEEDCDRAMISPHNAIGEARREGTPPQQ